MMHGKLVLLNWRAMAVKPLLHSLRIAGWEVIVEEKGGQQAVARIREILPRAVIIDLSYGATHGYRTGAAIYQNDSTRKIPVIFIGGTPEIVQTALTHVPTGLVTTVPQLATILSELGEVNDTS